ncbi:GlcNAc-domain-containing protein [Thamnocephalis sphaerospora]|uniref:GlcNAc-domain-containing protein n=1 Tax=Thamnocephalis sphaerospora TaxID=78915 RepID=A0A4V1IWH7_9FUNG|nr:GlcNAc-domain-containing protein [Thamnocephalis sphaerospora]|eukprot:RKP07599.1 GlcNAc-domain-containing protein [Thamnocephalis sphaerospora]
MQDQRLRQLPAALQLRILSSVLRANDTGSATAPSASPLVDSGSIHGAHTPSIVYANEQPGAADLGALADLLLHRVAAKGYAVVDGLFPDMFLDQLQDACEARRNAGHLKPAGMGTGATRWQDSSVRGDVREYLPLKDLLQPAEAVSQSPLGKVAERITALVDAVSAHLCTPSTAATEQTPVPPLDYTAIQHAYYSPTGTRYVRHRDLSPLNPDRRLTFILYLTRGWCKERGGELLLYPSPNTDTSTICVTPLAGRLLVFRSDLMHEVLPSYGDRHALTLWAYHATPLDDLLATYRHRACAMDNNLTQDDLDDGDMHGTIFVSIPAYRDPEAHATVQSLLGQARFPGRIRVGLLYQLVDEDERERLYAHSTLPASADITDAALYPACDWPVRGDRVVPGGNNRPVIRALTIPAAKAAGPCPARATIQERLYGGERYYLQVDAHMRFAPDWDVRLVQDLRRLERTYRRPILTDYPPGYTPNCSIDKTATSLESASTESAVAVDDLTGATLAVALDSNQLYATRFDDDGMLRLSARPRLAKVVDGDNEYRRQPFVAAGFLFGRADPILTHCPYDPTLRWLFFGEEALLSARLWTHGFDFFAPDTLLGKIACTDTANRSDRSPQPSPVVCWHQWQRTNRATSWAHASANNYGDRAAQERRTAQQLVCQILNPDTADAHVTLGNAHCIGGRYGLGTMRTIDSFTKCCGVDFGAHTLQ